VSYSEALQQLLHEPRLEVQALFTVQLSQDPKAAEEVVTGASTTVDASWLGIAYTSDHLVK
jgi:hypothetical protein